MEKIIKRLIEYKKNNTRLDTLSLDEQENLLLASQEVIKQVQFREFIQTLRELDKNGSDHLNNIKEQTVKQAISYLQSYVDTLEEV